MDLQAKIADLIYTHVSSMGEVNGIEDAADAVLEALPEIAEAQARIAKPKLALGRIAKARTYDDIYNQTEVWELDEISRQVAQGNNMTRKTNSYYAGDDIGIPVRPDRPSRVFDRNSAQSLRDQADFVEAYDSYNRLLKQRRPLVRARREELQRDLANENDMSMAQAAVLFTEAWEEGHSEGFNAVIDRFEQLVEIIENFNQAGEE